MRKGAPVCDQRTAESSQETTEKKEKDLPFLCSTFAAAADAAVSPASKPRPLCLSGPIRRAKCGEYGGYLKEESAVAAECSLMLNG